MPSHYKTSAQARGFTFLSFLASQALNSAKQAPNSASKAKQQSALKASTTVLPPHYTTEARTSAQARGFTLLSFFLASQAQNQKRAPQCCHLLTKQRRAQVLKPGDLLSLFFFASQAQNQKRAPQCCHLLTKQRRAQVLKHEKYPFCQATQNRTLLSKSHSYHVCTEDVQSNTEVFPR